MSKSEEKYRDLFETVQEIFYIDRLIYDENGKVVDWIFEDLNPAGLALLSLKDIDQAKGKRGSEVLGCEVASFYLPMIEKARKSSKAVTFQYRSPCVDKEFLTSYVVRGDRLITVQMDVTELKCAEEALLKANETLKQKVKERTAELENAYNTLKESEERLADAQRIAHVGSWDWNILTGKEYWSDENYHIFGRSPQELGANHEAFLSYIHPDDQSYVDNAIKETLNGKPYNIEFRIILPDGAERIVHTQGGAIFDEKNIPVRMRGTAQDVTELKKAEEAFVKIEIARKQEIHHRIKNNLQVISSLLDLQAEQFRDKECIKDSEVLEAFRESQNRVISMALIHEELHKGEGFEKLNFSSYIKELAENLLLTYRVGNKDIRLKTDMEENIFFDMDIAVPLGMIINEIVTNSLKHAFINRDEGEVRIKLNKEEGRSFILIVSDNGVGIPEDLEIEDSDTLGMQLVTTLVDQLDGKLELNRDNGTEFIIRYTVPEKDNQASEAAPQVIE